jgi:hypothetical protein
MAFGARVFNGIDTLIDAGAVVTGTNNALSLSFWVNPHNFANAYNWLTGSDQNDDSTVFGTLLKSSGKIAYYTTYAGGAYTFLDPGTTTLSVDTWYQVGMSLDASFLQTYVNGVSDGTVASNGVSLLSGTQNFVMGSQPASAGRNFNGRIADVAIWNVVLTAAEFVALAAGIRPNTVRPASLKGYWPLDGVNSPEPDLSGFGNNGTLTGTANAAGPPLAMFTPRWSQFLSPAAAAGGVGLGALLSTDRSRIVGAGLVLS